MVASISSAPPLAQAQAMSSAEPGEAMERVPDNEAAETTSKASLPAYMGNRVDTSA